MKPVLLAPALLVCAFMCCASKTYANELFDFDWRFEGGDVPGLDAVAFDDSQWRTVDLPHDFCIEGPFDPKVLGGTSNGFRPLGVGWYRKAFVTPANAEEKIYRLDFEGVFQRAKVWVNGKLAAENASGWHGFEINLSPYLQPEGQTNVIAVRADASKPAGVTWYNGGGIYRHVWLIESGKIHFARHGTVVTTPKISFEEATVHVRTQIENQSDADSPVELVCEVFDGDAKSVGISRSSVATKRGEISGFEQEIVIRNPRHWNLDQPAMYRLVSRVNVGGRQSDSCDSQFGIREIRLTPDGLYLNGKREFVKGFNIHDDYGCLGVAAFDRAIERRLRTLKEIGINAVRLAHNPHAPALLNACDRLGILVFDEAFCNWGDFEKGEFARNWKPQLEEFVRRDQNHPSVFVWSVGNQVSAAERGPDFGRTPFDAMASVVRGLDATRSVTSALRPYNREKRDIHPLVSRMDVMSANYMEQWFARDRLRQTNLIFITSECTTGDGGRSPWRDLDRDHAVGLFYWGGIDYIGESRGWPEKCWRGGFVDWAGYRKPSSWILESLISDRPMVRLLVKRPDTTYTNWDGVVISIGGQLAHWNKPVGEKQGIEVVSNAEEVELLLNGKSLGIREAMCDSSQYWTAKWEPGILSAVARNGGREVARHELRTAGAAKRLSLTPDRMKLQADGQDLAHITVEVVDENGVVVPDANQRIDFSVTGAGKNVGVQNSDPTSDEQFQAGHGRTYQGRALLVVRAKRKTGAIVIQAAGGGLASGAITLPVR